MGVRRPPAWLLVAALAGLAGLTLFMWKGPDPIISGMDIVLHGGWSFLLVLAGNFVVRNRRPPVPGSAVLSAVIIFGIAVEAVQNYLHIDFWAGDIVIDAIGALSGWLVWLLAARRIERTG